MAQSGFVRVQRKFCEGAARANADTQGAGWLHRWGRWVALLGSLRLKTKGIRVNMMVFADFIYDANILNNFEV